MISNTNFQVFFIERIRIITTGTNRVWTAFAAVRTVMITRTVLRLNSYAEFLLKLTHKTCIHVSTTIKQTCRVWATECAVYIIIFASKMTFLQQILIAETSFKNRFKKLLIWLTDNQKEQYYLWNHRSPWSTKILIPTIYISFLSYG